MTIIKSPQYPSFNHNVSEVDLNALYGDTIDMRSMVIGMLVSHMSKVDEHTDDKKIKGTWTEGIDKLHSASFLASNIQSLYRIVKEINTLIEGDVSEEEYKASVDVIYLKLEDLGIDGYSFMVGVDEEKIHSGIKTMDLAAAQEILAYVPSSASCSIHPSALREAKQLIKNK